MLSPPMEDRYFVPLDASVFEKKKAEEISSAS
jgi:hypothetical protein